jgi:uncharacterized protein (TIGR00299 family) protein
MKIAYLDCTSGIAGDMCLGALIDCGVPLDYLVKTLESAGLAGEFDLSVTSVHRQGQPALQVSVDLLHPSKEARHWPDIEALIDKSTLSPRVKAMSRKVFYMLAQAEARVHDQPIDHVHFHEVGAIDALVDIIGTCIGLEWLEIERIMCSPHPIGGGWVQAEHGQMAVPVPAVIQLWEEGRVPVFSNGVDAELVTPTGAALSVGLAESFGDCPSLRVAKVGRGAGSRELPIPNVLRIWIGEGDGSDLSEMVAVLETQIDDLNPQIIACTCDRLLELGALDVFTQAITMKQGRPGTLLTVICPVDRILECETLIFSETTTLGIRQSLQKRTILERTLDQVQTPFGDIAIKVARRYGHIVNVQPEFRDCVALSRQFQVPVQTVWLSAHAAWQKHHQP